MHEPFYHKVCTYASLLSTFCCAYMIIMFNLQSELKSIWQRARGLWLAALQIIEVLHVSDKLMIIMTLCRKECGTLVDFLEAICMGQGKLYRSHAHSTD